MAYNDNTANHDSHDHGTDIKVDAQFRHLLSNINGPNNGRLAVDSVDAFAIPRTSSSGGRSARSRARRARPSSSGPFRSGLGRTSAIAFGRNGSVDLRLRPLEERVCAPRPRTPISVFIEVPYYHTEIHPPRAIASMRNQAATLPSSGTTPVPVTATDLYIHGRAGMVGDVAGRAGCPSCWAAGSATSAAYPHRGFSINEDFDFDICLPVRPTADARLEWTIACGSSELGPAVRRAGDHEKRRRRFRNAPTRTRRWMRRRPSTFTSRSAVRAVSPDEVYARRITAGWIDPPNPTLQHLNVSVDRIDLHDSKDNDELFNPFCGADGELSFLLGHAGPRPRQRVDPAGGLRAGRFERHQRDERLRPRSPRPLLRGSAGRDVGFLRAPGPVAEPSVERLPSRITYDQFFGDHHMNVATPYSYCFASPTTCRDNNNDELDKIDAEISCTGLRRIDPATGMVTLHPASPLKPRFIIRPRPALVQVLRLRVRRHGRGASGLGRHVRPRDHQDLFAGSQARPSLLASRVQPWPGLPRNVVVDDVITASAGPDQLHPGNAGRHPLRMDRPSAPRSRARSLRPDT